MPARLLIVLAFFLLASACSSSRKATKDKDSVTVNLDTIEVTASRDNPYRASATKDFDLTHTKLEVKFDYAKQHLIGKATITLKPHFYPQHELVLDAKQFDIREVSLVTGENAREGLKFTYDSLQLKIQLDKEYTRDDKLKIYIDYTAKPEERKIGGSAAIEEDKGLYFINPLGTDTMKPTQVWTQGETESNSCWFPTIDKPNQKMTDEIYITHLKKYVSLSNGTLVSSVSVNDSMVTDYWKMSLPHAPYLVMMAVGNFTIVNDRWRDVPVSYYVEPEYAAYAGHIFGNAPQMMEFFSQKLGFDYPWEKYAQVVVRDYVSGAMENTSATLHSEILQRNDRELLDETYEDVISHELFHQWFGDLVTVESWSNTPLNESFATYGEYMWNEYKYSREYADFKFYDNYEKYLEEAKDKNVDLIRFYYNDREEMFDRHSYEKGGLVLHYLRSVVGDEAFFKSLELYLKTNQFKTVEIDQLRLAFEEVTGKDLNWFFNEWFLNSGHPVLDITYNHDADSVYVKVEQKHNISKELVYQLPMRIDVWYGKIVNSYNVVLKKKSETFAFKAYGTPDLIDADAERVVLCEKKENKNIDNYVFQYANTPLYVQRYEAIEKLAAAQKENAKAKLAVRDAIKDGAYHIREYVVNKLEISKEDTAEVYPLLEKVAKEDSSSWVRKEAIERLSEAPSPVRYVPLFESAINDSSYEVAGAALKALNSAAPEKAMQAAKKLENERNNNVLSAVADVYSKEGDSLYQVYFSNKLRKSTGISKYSLFYYYAHYLTRMNKNIVLPGIKVIEEEGMTTDQHFLTGAAKGSLKRITKSFEDKKKKAQSDLNKAVDEKSKSDLQANIHDYETIVSNINEALERLNKKSALKKTNGQ